MSNRLMNLVWPLSLPQTEKSVLIALADRADDATGQTWIAIRSLQVPRKLDLITMTGLSERTIQNAIKALAGVHLTRKDVPGRGVIYTVHPRTTCTPAHDAPPQEMHPAGDAATPAGAAPKPSVTLNPSKASPSSGRERMRADAQMLIARVMIDIVVAGCRASAPKPAAKRRWPKDMPPPAGVSDEQWAGFVDHRKARRSALTPRAYELLCKRLATLAAALPEWPPGRVIDTIVERNWLSAEQSWLTRLSEQENGTGHHHNRSGQRGGGGRSSYRDPLLRHYADGGDPGLGEPSRTR